MLKLVKALHLVGIVMFFGSILGHITLGFDPDVQADAQTILTLRKANAAATYILTLPGLTLAFLTGVLLIAKGGLAISKTRWLMLHAVFGLLIAVNSVFVLYPIGQELLDSAAQVVAGSQTTEHIQLLEGREAAFGAVNVLLCFAALFIAAIGPEFGRRTP